MLVIRYILAVFTAGFALMLLAAASEFATDVAHGTKFPTAFVIVAIPLGGLLVSLIAFVFALPLMAIAYSVSI
jgi:hypothetical protein